MKFNVGCHLEYGIAQLSTLLFNISVVHNPYQKILQESLQLHPQLDFDEYVAPLSENRYVRVNALAGDLQISYRATVELSHFYTDPNTIPEIQPADLPIDVFYYLYPSRYCQSDRLMRLAACDFGNLEPGYSRVTAICNWIYDNVAYLSGSSDPQTSAYDTATERAGVCRDFAHLGIAFCRALNIPARFVTGYAYGLNPPDFHACFEAYLGHRWYLFDPTRLAPQNGFIRIGTGRDAADVSFATLFGAVQMQQMRLFAEHALDANTASEVPAPTTAAIAIS
jgi:transglutaminase-like putative cysteine protease